MQVDLLTTVIAWLLAGVLAPALYHKVHSWHRFTANLYAYRLLPELLLKPAAALLVGVEAMTAIALLLVPLAQLSALSAFGFAAAGLLFILYLLAMGINVVRGRPFIDCGCGDEPTSLGVGVLLRNLVLASLAFAGLHLAGQAQGAGWLEWLLGLGFVLVAVGLYQALEQLLANRTKHQRLWLGM